MQYKLLQCNALSMRVRLQFRCSKCSTIKTEAKSLNMRFRTVASIQFCVALSVIDKATGHAGSHSLYTVFGVIEIRCNRN